VREDLASVEKHVKWHSPTVIALTEGKVESRKELKQWEAVS
jgi:hypothetical protein